ncbi:arsenate reductase [Marivivens niveibacter]|uniref:Arsenate reductase n=1 Tax=Marivivens niveibacter TaxID=1930667 RepID=A0A251WYY4_9RHOB|nr:ArsC/Spx/MgsR family protein [Marivivens niveibacter]OUD09274.1 arsenate reductase [Marivivens niveibacter]
MKVYSLKTCDTCRKTIKELAGAGYEFDVVDIRADGLNDQDIADIVAVFGDKSVNKASSTWRNLSDVDKAKSPAELIAEHPTAMKRPVIIKDGQFYQGWTAATKSALLPG